MDRNQKPFDPTTPTAPGNPTGSATGGTPLRSGQQFNSDPNRREVNPTGAGQSAPHGPSFVGHVPGSDVEAGDRPSGFGKSTVQREAHMAAEDNAASPIATAGQKINEFADTLRERAPEGKVGELVSNAAGALEKSGDYFGSASLDSMRGDMESLIRRYPVQSLAVGLGIGFLMARALRR
jgi:hypothetical protein